MELKIAKDIIHVRVEPAGRDHWNSNRNPLPPTLVPNGSIILTGDDPMIKGRAGESQRRKELAAHELVERQPTASLQDVPGDVYAEIGVFEVMTDRESQPSVPDAAAVGFKGAPPHFEIAANGSFVGESCRVAEQVAQCDLAFGVGFRNGSRP